MDKDDSELIEAVAEGYAFDTIQAVRAMARRLKAMKAWDSATMDVPTERSSSGIEELEQVLMNVRLASALRAAGYGSISAVRSASDEELLGVSGVGEKTVDPIRKATSA